MGLGGGVDGSEGDGKGEEGGAVANDDEVSGGVLGVEGSGGGGGGGSLGGGSLGGCKEAAELVFDEVFA